MNDGSFVSRRLRHAFWLSAIYALGLYFSACAAPSKAQDRRILRTPQAVASARVDRAAERAADRITSQEWHRLAVRYNPSYCDSPAWEVYMHGRWQRAELTPEPSSDETQMTHASLRPTGTTIQNARGWKYPSLEWRPSDDPP